MLVSRYRTSTALLFALSAMLCCTAEADGSRVGYGSFRPLDPAAQSDPRMTPSQIFSQQNYPAPVAPPPSGRVYSSPSMSARESSLYGQAPTAMPGYKFRKLPGKTPPPAGLPKFRPESQSGKSPYAGGGSDGSWSQGVLGPAPMFRPIDEPKERAAVPPTGPTQWSPPGGPVGAYRYNPYRASPYPYYQGRGYGAPFPSRGGFPLFPFSPW
ncbi:MAG: hypothetical protein ABW166_18415 [Sedimenticola sp.]